MKRVARGSGRRKRCPLGGTAPPRADRWTVPTPATDIALKTGILSRVEGVGS